MSKRTPHAKKLREQRRQRGIDAGRAEHPNARIVRGCYYGPELIVECQLEDKSWRVYRLVEDALVEAMAADNEAMTA